MTTSRNKRPEINKLKTKSVRRLVNFSEVRKSTMIASQNNRPELNKLKTKSVRRLANFSEVRKSMMTTSRNNRPELNKLKTKSVRRLANYREVYKNWESKSYYSSSEVKSDNEGVEALVKDDEYFSADDTIKEWDAGSKEAESTMTDFTVCSSIVSNIESSSLGAPQKANENRRKITVRNESKQGVPMSMRGLSLDPKYFSKVLSGALLNLVDDEEYEQLTGVSESIQKETPSIPQENQNKNEDIVQGEECVSFGTDVPERPTLRKKVSDLTEHSTLGESTSNSIVNPDIGPVDEEEPRDSIFLNGIIDFGKLQDDDIDLCGKHCVVMNSDKIPPDALRDVAHTFVDREGLGFVDHESETCTNDKHDICEDCFMPYFNRLLTRFFV